MNKIIIGITGKGRSGKNTVADMLGAMHLGDIKELAFAGLMKDFAQVAFGWDFNDPNFDKDVPQDNGIVPREFLQHFGTEYMRERWLDTVWVDVIERQLKEVDIMYLITDVRFDNEAVMIKRHGGVIIEVTRPGGNQVRNHSSEGGINPDFIDFAISNDGALVDLEVKTRRVYNTIMIG